MNWNTVSILSVSLVLLAVNVLDRMGSRSLLVDRNTRISINFIRRLAGGMDSISFNFPFTYLFDLPRISRPRDDLSRRRRTSFISGRQKKVSPRKSSVKWMKLDLATRPLFW